MHEISLARLTLMLLPLVAVGWISWRWASQTTELAIATARMVVQLLAMGYVLVILFGVEDPTRCAQRSPPPAEAAAHGTPLPSGPCQNTRP